MCLYTKDSKLKTTDRDIPCFKVIVRTRDGLYRPYFRQEYAIHEDIVKGARPYEARGEAMGLKVFNALYSWGEGLVHTFKYYADLYQAMRHALVFECTIPSGTEYLEGVDNNGTPCYAARRIVFGRLVYDGTRIGEEKFG